MTWLFGRKKTAADDEFDPNPGTMDEIPARPYRVLHADLPFYSDPECKAKVNDASLIVLKTEDPEQNHSVQECMPTRKKYEVGQLVQWDLNNKKIWQTCWYKNPESGAAERLWIQAVEFIGKIVKTGKPTP
jgi:hypothetical protein